MIFEISMMAVGVLLLLFALFSRRVTTFCAIFLAIFGIGLLAHHALLIDQKIEANEKKEAVMMERYFEGFSGEKNSEKVEEITIDKSKPKA